MSYERYWVMGVRRDSPPKKDSVFMMAWDSEIDGPLTFDNAKKVRDRKNAAFPHVRYFVIALHNTLC